MAQPQRIYGLIGYPVKHSLSAAMHNAAFKALNIDAHYELFEVRPEDLGDFLNDLDKNNIYGLNVTIPHKVTVFKNKAVQKDALCFLAGAANTLKREGKRLTCYNTDIQGFVDSLREDLKFNSDGKSVFIFGCGGASRAVIAGLTMKATRVKKIYLYDIKKEAIDSTRKYFDNFQEVKGRLEYFSDAQRIPQEIKGIDLLINASPVGMREGDSSIIDKGLFSERLSVYDLVYNRQTQLIQDAQSLNLNCIGGLKMLWRQGMLSFKIWTGKDAPAEVMWQALSSQILTK